MRVGQVAVPMAVPAERFVGQCLAYRQLPGRQTLITLTSSNAEKSAS